MKDELSIRPVAEAKQQAARNIAAQHDAIVFSLVRDRLPSEEIIKPEQLRGRLEAFHFAGKPYREYVLDGRPLVRFWEPELEWEGTTMTITQRYQVLT
jgi:hypothetical protein